MTWNTFNTKRGSTNVKLKERNIQQPGSFIDALTTVDPCSDHFGLLLPLFSSERNMNGWKFQDRGPRLPPKRTPHISNRKTIWTLNPVEPLKEPSDHVKHRDLIYPFTNMFSQRKMHLHRLIQPSVVKKLSKSCFGHLDFATRIAAAFFPVGAAIVVLDAVQGRLNVCTTSRPGGFSTTSAIPSRAHFKQFVLTFWKPWQRWFWWWL